MSEKREKAAAKWKAEEEEKERKAEEEEKERKAEEEKKERQREEAETASANGNSAADTPPKEVTKEVTKEPVKEEAPAWKSELPKATGSWTSGRTTPGFGAGISRTPTADREREQSDTLSEFEKVRCSSQGYVWLPSCHYVSP